MSIEDEAEKALFVARKKAIRKKVFENLEKFTYQAEHVERSRLEEDWLCRLSAIGPKGEIVRGLRVTVRTPSALNFDRTYGWDLLSLCPLWVEVYRGVEVYRFSANTKPVFGFDR